MKRISDHFGKYLLCCELVLVLFAPFAGAHAQTIYSFTGGSDGGNPPCGLISGGRGVLPSPLRFYGTTELGGSGYGTVYEVTSTGFETVLHPFTGGSDGAYPQASLIMDTSGNLYGTTLQGGAYGDGVVFKVTAGGSETVLHSFGSGSDGADPYAGLIEDSAGNFYGATAGGGTYGYGTVFEVTPAGSETVLYSFTGGSDGAEPFAAMIMDTGGNLYGTTVNGGTYDNGVVFKLAPGGSETVLHSFGRGSDGALPYAGVIMDKGQNLYGATEVGGTSDNGTVFKISRSGKETILHSFTGGSDGGAPVAALIEKGGYFYGTTAQGGTSGYGTVFKLPSKGGADTVLYSFTGGSDGAFPIGAVLDKGGKLFSTTSGGGLYGTSVVFEITP